MRISMAIAIVCFVAAVTENDGVAHEPKKEKTPVVRVLKGWSLEKLGGDEELYARSRLLEWPGVGDWPPVGVVYKSLDEVARACPDKKFLQKLDKEVDFSKNILLRYSWKGAGPPVFYRV